MNCEYIKQLLLAEVRATSAWEINEARIKLWQAIHRGVLLP